MAFNWLYFKKRTDTERTGLWGERKAAIYLRRKGYRIVGRRVRVGRHDELDLLALHNETLIFIEVKTRGSEQFGRPADAVDPRKKRALSRAAVAYMRKLSKRPPYIRFDIIEVVGQTGSRHPKIVHIENAFRLHWGEDAGRA